MLQLTSKVKNSAGKLITLNRRESLQAINCDKMANALGYQIDTTTLTAIVAKITEQKFYEVPFAEYVPVKVGNGAFMTQLLTYLSFALAGDFEKGIINTGGNNARLASADAGVQAVAAKVVPWAEEIGWTLFEVAYASKSGNWDIVQAKEIARKKVWDLGLQRLAFLGLNSDTSVQGLLNLSGITTVTDIITQPLSTLDPTSLNQVLQTILAKYRSNCNNTAWPSRFTIPESDWLGLGAYMDPNFPIKTKKQAIEDMFKEMIPSDKAKKEFRLLPSAYANYNHNNINSANDYYALYNYDETSLRMDIPIDYTGTAANTVNGFSFQNVGYGQFTGVYAYRPTEMLYFSCAAIPPN